MTVHIAADLKRYARPVDELIPLPDNPRHGDIGAISESLKRFGQLKPIVVDGEGLIIAGNHTYLAAVSLGWKKVAAVNPEHLDGGELAAFALADNRLSDLADYDEAMLMEQLSALRDLTGTGYSGDDLDELRLILDEPLSFEEFDSTDARLDVNKGTGRILCPNCNHEFQWKDRGKPST